MTNKFLGDKRAKITQPLQLKFAAFDSQYYRQLTRFEQGANLKKNAHKNQVLSLKVLPMGSSKSAIWKKSMDKNGRIWRFIDFAL